MNRTIKAISLWQPWASLIAIGEKQFETRSWDTSYLGLVAIHAAKRWTLAELQAFSNFNQRFPDLTQRWNYTNDQMHPLPLGSVLCVCRLKGCYRTNYLNISEREMAFGNFAPGRFAWKLELVETFDQPIPAKGAQGLWNWQWEGGAM